MSDETKPKRKDYTSKETKRLYAKARLAALNEAAQRAGFDSWRNLEKAVKAGAGVMIPAKS